MAEKLRGHRADGPDGARSRTRAIDDSLTWVRPPCRHHDHGQLGWWPEIDRELVDFHARYERACIED